MSRARFAGVEIAYEIAGESGDPVVLVHGLWVDRRTWVAVVPLLARSLRVLTYDLRGHGESDHGPAGTDAHVRDLAALLEGLDWAPAHVVGGSFGGRIALALAAERPDLVRSVSVHEPSLLELLDDSIPEARAARAALQEARDRVGAGELEAGARRFAEGLAFGPGAWARLPEATRATFVRHARRWLEESDADPPGFARELLARLAAFDPPALVTSGEASPLPFPLVADRVAAALPNAARRVLPGTGHAPHWTDPELYAGSLLTFTLERSVPTG